MKISTYSCFPFYFFDYFFICQFDIELKDGQFFFLIVRYVLYLMPFSWSFCGSLFKLQSKGHCDFCVVTFLLFIPELDLLKLSFLWNII